MMLFYFLFGLGLLSGFIREGIHPVERKSVGFWVMAIVMNVLLWPAMLYFCFREGKK